MKEYNGSGLTPLFHSEISSSYMVYDILNEHKEILQDLIQHFFHIHADSVIVERERSYPKKGSIDIFVEFTHAGKKSALLIEVKVHDYLSATENQIITYYNAVLEDSDYDEVYFMYLTQFTKDDSFSGIATPRTLKEAKKARETIKERFLHISWKKFHQFLSQYDEKLTEEQRLMASLQKQWIDQQCLSDLQGNKIDVGERGLGDYFPDLHIDMREKLPFGSKHYEKKKQIWRIDVGKLHEQQLEELLKVIETYTHSSAINKLKQYKTEEATLQAAKDFLVQLAQSPLNWRVLSFYAKLFLLAETIGYLKFYGTGTRGFSIKLEILGKGEISLCTINKNKTIDFSLKR